MNWLPAWVDNGSEQQQADAEKGARGESRAARSFGNTHVLIPDSWKVMETLDRIQRLQFRKTGATFS
jgi:hypothetical protein